MPKLFLQGKKAIEEMVKDEGRGLLLNDSLQVCFEFFLRE